MTTFFIDLWHDLREKRLWPVAVGLLAAIVAVPVILFKPASAPSGPAVAVPQRNAPDTLPVVSVDDGPTQGSRLESFSEKNPFKPMKDLAKDTTPRVSAPKGGGPASGGSSSGAPLGGSHAGGSPAGGSPAGGSSTGGSGSTGTPGGGTPSSPGGASPSATPRHTSIQWFRYVADLSFGEPGATKKIASAPLYSLLPDAKHPTIVYLGTGDDYKSVVLFIADPAFTAAGEGKCNAPGAACRFVTLRTSDSADEETFASTDGSVTYAVKLLGIHRQNLPTDSSGNPKPAPKSTAKTIETTGAGVDTTAETSERLLPDLLASGPGVAREQK
jgi:hypothetical protein